MRKTAQISLTRRRSGKPMSFRISSSARSLLPLRTLATSGSKESCKSFSLLANSLALLSHFRIEVFSSTKESRADQSSANKFLGGLQLLHELRNLQVPLASLLNESHPLFEVPWNCQRNHLRKCSFSSESCTHPSTHYRKPESHPHA